ncbi:AAA family ATPase [Alistipes sp.]|uniref:AAA family ATPase n=1 Tax=Alistipes sp. TaxID=1872444 RepID=UPI003AEFFE25
MLEEELRAVSTALYNPYQGRQAPACDYEPYVMDLSRRIAEPVPVVRWNGMIVGSEGNLSAVVGEAKSKKTFLASAVAGGVLSASDYMGFGAQPGRVLWIDTEQADTHVLRVMQRVHRMAGFDLKVNEDRFWTLALRELAPRDRTEVAFAAIEQLRPRLVVVDGIGDLQNNTNDLEESERIVCDLMRISSQLSCHILSVLHTNPNSDKARGHTGSSLQRKAETVLYVRRAGEVTVVEPQFCRNEPFDRFAFRIDREGLPVECDLPQTGPAGEDPCVTLLRDELGGMAQRALLTTRLSQQMDCSVDAVRMRITRAIRAGRLSLSEDGREVSIPW